MTELSTEAEILAGLDFDPDADITVLPKEESEKSKTCTVVHSHPTNPDDRYKCGRPAAWKINLHLNTCGHKLEAYMCASCWDGFGPMNPRSADDWTHGNGCGTLFSFRASIVSFERITK